MLYTTPYQRCHGWCGAVAHLGVEGPDGRSVVGARVSLLAVRHVHLEHHDLRAVRSPFPPAHADITVEPSRESKQNVSKTARCVNSLYHIVVVDLTHVERGRGTSARVKPYAPGACIILDATRVLFDCYKKKKKRTKKIEAEPIVHKTALEDFR